MALFHYARAADAAEAFARGQAPGAVFIAGGTDLLQLVQERVTRPAEVIDLARVLDHEVACTGVGVRIGAGARLADVAAHPLVSGHFPVVAEALLATASPQVRNLATAGGNLLQRTRCLYFRDVATACNKREPGSGCSAQEGQNRMNAIFGGSPHCIAVQPSDFAVALVACDAEVELAGPHGDRRVAVADFHRLPGETPHIETVMHPGEVITAVHLPAEASDRRSRYLKVRDRASFEWAICAVALSIALDGEAVRELRVVAGGVATKPWRLTQVEAALQGQTLSEAAISAAAERACEGAELREHNAFKAPLLIGAVRKALREFARA
jgi:xanthine dehydrogenase YagS FAD-binding subunit